MDRRKLLQIRREYFDKNHQYEMAFWKDFNYRILSKILYIKKAGRGDNSSYNDCLIMADTETSKKKLPGVHENHVVAWTISIRAFDRNIVTLWGRKPSEMVQCIKKITGRMPGENTHIYFHNLAYDWVFLRQFFFDVFGVPAKQLNTKAHYPIYIKFDNGVIFRDSLILAQRKLEKWADDMNVEHKKAVGKWDYDKYRTQYEDFSPDELTYIENDTLAGVECLQATMDALEKHTYSIPYTATGIPREEMRIRGKKFNAHEWFERLVPDYDQQQKFERVYHGGYTHGNRHYLSTTICGIENGFLEYTTKCLDFASSYPYVMLSEKYPAEAFHKREDCTIDYILKNADQYAYAFKLVLFRFRLKDDSISMPALQKSKLVKSINCIEDNGRILCGDYAEIYINEQDLQIIVDQYEYKKHLCIEVEYSYKDYLPRWITDYIFSLFEEKQKLKGGDPVLYALAKARLNSIYGLFVQKPVRDDIIEDYETGEYVQACKDLGAEYDAYIKRPNSILPYFIGVWVTSYAMKNLFILGNCVDTANGGIWLYSDTDSIYATKWDDKKVSEYNQKCKEKLIANNYGAAEVNGKEYWLGLATEDHIYTEFRYCGAKRYCGRDIEDGKLKITVAGVPKKGALCLDDNIENFATGFIFPGTKTGKKTHTYFYNKIYIDPDGNETGDSIDLSSCDYLLDSVVNIDWMDIFGEEQEVQVYEE